MVRTTLWMSESLASSAGLGCRTTLVQIQPSRLKRKGKPTGDGTRPEPGRATSLEGSTPSPSAASEVPVAERPRRRSSKPDRRVRLPPGALCRPSAVGDRRLFDKEADDLAR